jgi:cadmium resistance protein CadD (predicted permease)
MARRPFRNTDLTVGNDLSDLNTTVTLAELIGVMGVTATAFVSTNVDNLVLVSAYGARPGIRPLLLKLTFVLVCLAVLLVSLVLARAADTLPADKIRYLGLIPIGIGTYQAIKLFTGRAGDEDPAAKAAPELNGVFAYLSFGLVLLANSSDSVAMLTPLLADLKPAFVAAYFAAVLAVALAMSFLAQILVRQPALRVYLEKFAKWALPFLLIGIGLLILTDEPADIFVG